MEIQAASKVKCAAVKNKSEHEYRKQNIGYAHSTIPP